MQKVRILTLSLAIVIGVVAAMAKTPKAPCSSLPQFYKVGNSFYPAGIEGYDYECQWDHFGTCTYYFDAATNSYRPCKAGKILWIR